ncbi:hypothetical protein [Nitrosomonas supralitoralis]|uniref:hypothetical protein n=1 Tax=Nitrosomonas supralitoralis TaxID=2116706 RepID=UPI001F5BF4E1|nr:hypothetical protein [Nitrosomonas supralitoralis]
MQKIKSYNNFLLNRKDRIANLLHFARTLDVKLPTLDQPNISAKGVYTRLTDENWWLRRLRKAHGKKLEQKIFNPASCIIVKANT